MTVSPYRIMDNAIGMQTQTQTQEAPKQGKGIFILMGFLACIFAVLVTKEAQLPPGILYPVALLAGALVFFAGMNRPEIITYVLVAYLPFSKVLAGDFGGFAQAVNATNALMLCIMVAWFSGRYAKNEGLWVRSALGIPIFIFMMLGLIAVVRGARWSGFPPVMVVANYKRWITPILMYFLVLNTVKERSMIKMIVNIMIGVTTLVGLMAIWDYMTLGEVSSLEKARIGGISGHSNSLAAFFNYYIFLPFGFFLMNMGRFKYWTLLVPFLIQFRGIMVTFSRGGYIAFAFGLYWIAWFRSKWLFLLLLAATGLAILNPVVLPSGIRYRLLQTFEKTPMSYIETTEDLEESLDASAANRVEIWKGAIAMIKEKPMFGFGYNTFLYQIEHYWSGGFRIDAHNTYLIIAAEMGLPALFVFLIILFIIYNRTYKLWKTTHDPWTKAFALGFLGGVFGMLMSNMFGSRLDSQEVSSYLWILIALVMRLLIIDSEERAAGIVTTEQKNEPAVNAAPKAKKLDSCWGEDD